MKFHEINQEAPTLSAGEIVKYSALSVACFHLAFVSQLLSFFLIGFVGCLLTLRRVPNGRAAFWVGFGIGYAIYAIGVFFFFNIFMVGALFLWGILATWLGFFLWALHTVYKEKGGRWALLLAPFLWLGFEYMRSEGYYLKFSWFSLGYEVSASPQSHVLLSPGVYGLGFLIVALSTIPFWIPGFARVMAAFFIGFAFFITTNLPTVAPTLIDLSAIPESDRIEVTGVHLEETHTTAIIDGLDRGLEAHPDSDILILGEYTFSTEPPQVVREWCRRHAKYVVGGGVVYQMGGAYENTAFVINPDGNIEHQQVKSVPIQFFDDGEQATSRQVWASPWGPIGIAVCYDLSYRRIMDTFVAQGARALLIPSREDPSWGVQQFTQHARVAPTRASEYRIPIVRVGAERAIAQVCDANGRIVSETDHEEERALIHAEIALPERGRLPVDRFLGPLAAAGCMLFLAWRVAAALRSMPLVHKKSPIKE